MLVDAFYDIWLDIKLFGLPEYPIIMLIIYRNFIGRKHQKALVQGVAFDEEALFSMEFTPISVLPKRRN